MFGNNYVKGKDLVKKHPGDIFTRQPNNYKNVLDFDKSMDDVKRKERVENLFIEFIVPFTNKTLSRLGLKELLNKKKYFYYLQLKKN